MSVHDIRPGLVLYIPKLVKNPAAPCQTLVVNPHELFRAQMIGE
jgi:hypothetical protein